MKKLILFIAFIIVSLTIKAQTDTTYTFVNDTIPAQIIVDTVLFESDWIIIDTITIDREFNQDYKLMPWFVRDSVNINTYKFALRHVQRGFKKVGTYEVQRGYRYRNVRYIRQPATIRKTIVYN